MSDENTSSASTPLVSPAARQFNESILVAGLWLVLMMQSQSPLGSTPLVWAMIAGVFIGVVVARNHLVSWGLICGCLLFFRIYFPISSWNDQHWIQWYGSTAVLTGHNPFAAAGLTQVSWANYFPTGSLFGALWLNLGIHSYWIPWHGLNLCLFSIPFILHRSLHNMVVFLALAAYFPLADYTGGGGTLEIGYALLIGGIYLLRVGQTIPAVILLAYGCLFRQPHIFVFGFVAIILWQRNERRMLGWFTLLALLFGGVFALANPQAFLDATLRQFDLFAQVWYNKCGGLRANYSVSTVMLQFGVHEATAWTGLKPFYLPVMLFGVGALLLLAWCKRQQEDWVIGAMLLSIPWIYFMSRGFVMYHYLVAACFPFAVLFTDRRPELGAFPCLATAFVRGVSVVVLGAGLAPIILCGGASLRQLVTARLEESRSGPQAVAISVAQRPILANQSIRAKLGEPVVCEFATPVTARGVRITGRPSGPIVLNSVAFKAWPPDGVVTRVLTQGELWASEDGVTYWLLQKFLNSINYNVYPQEIRFGQPKPFRFLKLVGLKAVGPSDEFEFQDIHLLIELSP